MKDEIGDFLKSYNLWKSIKRIKKEMLTDHLDERGGEVQNLLN
jgi:hypothetical protein